MSFLRAGIEADLKLSVLESGVAGSKKRWSMGPTVALRSSQKMGDGGARCPAACLLSLTNGSLVFLFRHFYAALERWWRPTGSGIAK